MNKSKYLRLVYTASVLCVIIAGYALFGPFTDGTIIGREPGERYEVSLQTDAGTRLEAVIDLNDNPSISAGDVGTAERTVNINTATAQELAEILPGIGSSKAEAIVEYRERMGGFTSVEELIEVEGIGAKLLSSISPYCTVSEPDGQ